MRTSLTLTLAVALTACGDGDGGTDARDDSGVQADGSAAPDADGSAGPTVDSSTESPSTTDPDAGEFPTLDAGNIEAGEGGVEDAGNADAHRGAANSWWTFSGGMIAAIQPVAGVLGSQVVVAGGRTSANLGSTGTNVTRYFTIPGAGETTLTVNTGNPMSVTRWGAAYAVVSGRLWAIGGAASIGISCLSSVESLGAATEPWMPGPPLPQGRCAASAAVLGQYLFVFGGTGAPVPNRPTVMAPATTCRLDTMNLPAGWDCSSFTAGNDVAMNNRFNAAVASNGLQAIVAGGRNMSGLLSAVELVSQTGGNPDFASGTVLPKPLNLAAAVATGSSYYVLGGTPMALNVASTAEMWRTPTANPGVWSPVTAAIGVPSARTGHAMLVARCSGCAADRIYVIGGHMDGVAVQLIDEYTE